MRYQATIQIVLIIISLAIVFLVVQPKLQEIKAVETEAAGYDNAIAKADQYNQQVQNLLDQANKIPQTSIDQLYTYLPDSVDELLVAKDIETIITNHNAIVNTITGNYPVLIEAADAQVTQENNQNPNSGVVAPDDVSQSNLQFVSQDFAVQFIASYENMKEILMDFERNAYPLRLVGFSYTVDKESSLQMFSVTLQTYALGEDLITGDGKRK